MSAKVYPITEAADILKVPKLLARTLVIEHGVPVLGSGKSRVVLPQKSFDILQGLVEEHRKRAYVFDANPEAALPR